jgi:hypothetical protein
MADKYEARHANCSVRQALALGCLGTAALLGGCFPPHFSAIPPELEEPNVVSGEGFLEKSEFVDFADDGSRLVGEIFRIEAIPSNDGDTIAAWSGNRVRMVDSDTGLTQAAISLEGRCLFAQVVDIENDGTPEFMCRGGFFQEVAVYDDSGMLLWAKSGTNEDGTVPNAMSAGDLDGDGIVEFCVAFSRSLACFDAAGEEIWREGEGDQYSGVAIISRDARQSGRVVSLVTDLTEPSDAPVHLEVRDGAGQLLRRVSLPRDITQQFRVIRWPAGTDAFAVLLRTSDGFALLDLEGQTLMEFALPSPTGGGYDIDGTVLRSGDQDSDEAYLAVLLVHFRLWDRASLLLFSGAGELVYHEVLGDGSAILSTQLSRSDDSADSLFVTDGPGRIVRYRLANLLGRRLMGDTFARQR